MSQISFESRTGFTIGEFMGPVDYPNITTIQLIDGVTITGWDSQGLAFCYGPSKWTRFMPIRRKSL